MAHIYTPLRYPGGKTKYAGLLESVIDANGLRGCTYAEPFAGGAGAALALLYRGVVSRVLLNDVDRRVCAFWRAALNHTKVFLRKLDDVPITMDEYQRQRDVYSDGRGTDLKLGFSFFYLNRCNRSGILDAGPVGGKNQNGTYKLDARFKKDRLKRKLLRLADFRDKITISQLDALDFLNQLDDSDDSGDVFVYLDPPYYGQGQYLYLNHYQHTGHASLAHGLGLVAVPWLISYDDVAETRNLYRDYRQYKRKLRYTAQEHKGAAELIIVSSRVHVDSIAENVGLTGAA